MSDRSHERASPVERLFTCAEYHTIGETGLFTSDERVELINGKIVKMFPFGSWHTSSTLRLERRLAAIYQETALVSAVHPVVLGDDSEPQPDISVLKPRANFYADAHPMADDVILIIEMSDSTRSFDLGTKHDLYAKHGIPEVWVVDKQSACVHVFRQPNAGLFTESRVYRSGEEIPLPLCGKSLAVAETGV